MNKYFYKEFRFWAGLILLYISANVYPLIFSGKIFTGSFWKSSSNLINLISVLIGLSFVVQMLFFNKKDRDA